jgi:pimeloyl-ACP methyl ester carboxylesterase
MASRSRSTTRRPGPISLTAAFKGDGSILLRLSDAYFERTSDGSYANNIGEVIYAVNCLDATDPLTQAETEALIPRFEKVSPVFGRSLAWGALACTDWPIKPTNPLPKITAEGAPPILVLGTTRDPATPYEWAQALASQLSSGVLVTRDGDGHTAYNSGNECITDAVDAFFTAGTVPEKGLTCH